jgi:serine protease AprX
MVASLKQQFPQYSAMKIRELLIKSASKYETPDNKIGYGIPSYKRFVELAQNLLAIENYSEETVIFPNPINNEQAIKIKINGIEISDNQHIEVFDLNGRRIFENTITMDEFRTNLSKFGSGTYSIKVQVADKMHTKRFIKL